MEAWSQRQGMFLIGRPMFACPHVSLSIQRARVCAQAAHISAGQSSLLFAVLMSNTKSMCVPKGSQFSLPNRLLILEALSFLKKKQREHRDSPLLGETLPKVGLIEDLNALMMFCIQLSQ